MSEKKEETFVQACAITSFIAGPGETIYEGQICEMSRADFVRFEAMKRVRVATEDDLEAAKKSQAAAKKAEGK